jgi:glycosyltransferase involved in cell wall biosynthesis
MSLSEIASNMFIEDTHFSGFSVLMSIYNAESANNLQQCLESLMFQTLKANELVLVEDGPISNALLHVIDEYRVYLNIVSVKIPLNVGLAEALNAGLSRCSYELIARMDTDDICLPSRFEKQVSFLQARPDIAVLGALVEEYNNDMSIASGVRNIPSEFAEIVKFAKRRSPLSHPTVMYRKSAVLAVGGYPAFRKAQDYALWSVMLQRGFKAHNLNEVLLKMRAGDGLMTRRRSEYLRHEIAIMKFQRAIGFISFAEYVFNVTARSIVRLSPTFITKLLYKFAR